MTPDTRTISVDEMLKQSLRSCTLWMMSSGQGGEGRSTRWPFLLSSMRVPRAGFKSCTLTEVLGGGMSKPASSRLLYA